MSTISWSKHAWGQCRFCTKEGDSLNELTQLSDLLRQHNLITTQIAHVIGRPAERGHIGEYIASKVFEITLSSSAVHKSIDGHFASGALVGRTVNVKWYGKWECLLDITPALLPDYYLALTGPKSAAMSSRGSTRPHIIEYVFLFEAAALHTSLLAGKVKIGMATSVRLHLWQEAEIYPTQRNQALLLSEEQRQLLSLFR
jgi:hypothetical protein